MIKNQRTLCDLRHLRQQNLAKGVYASMVRTLRDRRRLRQQTLVKIVSASTARIFGTVGTLSAELGESHLCRRQLVSRTQ